MFVPSNRLSVLHTSMAANPWAMPRDTSQSAENNVDEALQITLQELKQCRQQTASMSSVWKAQKAEQHELKTQASDNHKRLDEVLQRYAQTTFMMNKKFGEISLGVGDADAECAKLSAICEALEGRVAEARYELDQGKQYLQRVATHTEMLGTQLADYLQKLRRDTMHVMEALNGVEEELSHQKDENVRLHRYLRTAQN